MLSLHTFVRGTQKWNSVPKRGDVLFSKDGTVGKVYVVDTKERFAVLSSLAILRPDASRLYASYFGRVLKTDGCLDQASRSKTGSAIRRIILKDLKRVRFPLPPLADQQRIAGILDAADALRATRRESLAQLDTLLQSTFLDMFGDPVTNPMGWEECAVGDVTDCIVPGRDKPKSFTGSIPWITTDALVDLGVTSHSPKGIGLSPEEINQVSARVIPKGSVIISCVGDLGISSVAGRDLVVNQQLHTEVDPILWTGVRHS